MDDVFNYQKFSKKLIDYFKDNIKLTYVIDLAFMILRKDDKVFQFNTLNGVDSLFVSSDNNSVIESVILKELCDKEIVDFMSGFKHLMARNKHGQIFCWAIIHKDNLEMGPPIMKILILINL